MKLKISSPTEDGESDEEFVSESKALNAVCAHQFVHKRLRVERPTRSYLAIQCARCGELHLLPSS